MIYEILRLPMGLSFSVKIMQIVCLCIDGDHAVVCEKFSTLPVLSRFGLISLHFFR